MSRRKEYRRGVLSPTRIAALEAITGWEWNPHDAAWHRMLTHLDQAAHHHETVAHISQTAVIGGANIGHWGDGATHPTPPGAASPPTGLTPYKPYPAGTGRHTRPTNSPDPQRTRQHQVTANPRLPTLPGR